jgi:hypothetical protein
MDIVRQKTLNADMALCATNFIIFLVVNMSHFKTIFSISFICFVKILMVTLERKQIP